MCSRSSMRSLLVWAVVSAMLLTTASGQLSMSLPSLKTAQRGADFGLSATWSSLLNPQFGSSQTSTNLNLPGNTNYFGTQFLSGEPSSVSPQLQLPKSSTMDLSQLQQASQPQPAQAQGQRQNPVFNNYLTYPSYLQAISSDVFNPFGPGNPYNNVTASASQAPLQAVSAFPGVQQNFLQSPLTLPSSWSAFSPQTFQPATRTANFQPAPSAAQTGNALLNTNYLSQFTFPYGQGQFGYPLTFGQGTNTAAVAPAQPVQQPKPVTETKPTPQPPVKHARPNHRGDRPRHTPHSYETDEESREPETYRSNPSYEEEEEEEAEEEEEEETGPTYRSSSRYYKPGRPSEEEEEETPDDQYEESTSVNAKNCETPEDSAGFSTANFEEQFKSFPTNTNFRDPDFVAEATSVKEVTTPRTVKDEDDDSDDDDSDSSSGQRIPSTLHYYNYKPPKYNRHGKPAEYFPNNPFKKPKSEHSVPPHKRAPKKRSKESHGHHPSSKSLYMVKKMY